MRIIIIFILLCISGFTWASQALINIPAKYESNLSVLVINANTHQVLFKHNENIPRLIASNTKVFTSAFGLYYLKPDFKWHTQLFYTGQIKNGVLTGNIYIKGGGDPTLDDEGLNTILTSIKRLGIKTVHGNIIIDDKIFNSEPTFSELERLPYDVDTIPPYALMVNEDISKFTMHIRDNKVYLSSNLYGYFIKNHLYVNQRVTQCSGFSHGIKLSIHDKVISLRGAIPIGCNNKDLYYYLLSTKTYAEMSLEKSIKHLHIHVNQGYTYESVPQNAQLIFDYSSSPLQQVLITMNHNSDNLIAETIFLSVGAYKTNNTNTNLQSLELFNKFLKLNNLFQGVTVENGSGVSRIQKFSAKDVINLFSYIESNQMQKIIESSLPSPGKSGTLEATFLSFKGQLFAKTGTLNDTLAYSGYFYSHNKNKYIISIIFNNIDATNKVEVDEIKNLVLSILAQIDSIPKVESNSLSVKH